MGCVASRRELSAFDIKLPMRSTPTIRPTETVVLGVLPGVASSLASSSSELLECVELGRTFDGVSDVSLDDTLRLLADDVLSD